jgi:hypothetical protein
LCGSNGIHPKRGIKGHTSFSYPSLVGPVGISTFPSFAIIDDPADKAIYSLSLDVDKAKKKSRHFSYSSVARSLFTVNIGNNAGKVYRHASHDTQQSIACVQWHIKHCIEEKQWIKRVHN